MAPNSNSSQWRSRCTCALRMVVEPSSSQIGPVLRAGKPSRFVWLLCFVISISRFWDTNNTDLILSSLLCDQLWRITESTFQFKVFNKQFVGLSSQGDGVVAVSIDPGQSETLEIVRNADDPNRVRIKAPNGFFIQVFRVQLIFFAVYVHCYYQLLLHYHIVVLPQRRALVVRRRRRMCWWLRTTLRVPAGEMMILPSSSWP